MWLPCSKVAVEWAVIVYSWVVDSCIFGIFVPKCPHAGGYPKPGRDIEIQRDVVWCLPPARREKGKGGRMRSRLRQPLPGNDPGNGLGFLGKVAIAFSDERQGTGQDGKRRRGRSRQDGRTDGRTCVFYGLVLSVVDATPG